MNFNTLIWKNIHTRIWFLVFTITVTIVLAVSLLATQVQFLSGTLNIVLGRPRPIFGTERGLYVSEYETKSPAYDAGNLLNIELAEEGFTLLRNENNALPLAKKSRISIFGKNSVDLLYGGSGSGGAGENAEKKSLFQSLEAAELSYNPKLKEFYENTSQSGGFRPTVDRFSAIFAGEPTYETALSRYTEHNIPASYSEYSDAALVVLTRIGGEGFDLPRTMGTSYTSDGVSGLTDGARSSDCHYLQLDANERDLLLHVTEYFENVIIVLNSNNVLELGFLDDVSYWTDALGVPAGDSRIQRAMDRLNGVISIGSPGGHGIMALGRILNGDVNPSGHNVDIYARDFTLDPTFNNFGNNSKDNGDAYLTSAGKLPSKADRYFFTDYEEGIYIGYRYYETRGFTDDAAWYNDNVIYPFGYGLSYSEFDWVVGDIKIGETVMSDDYTLSEADFDKLVSVDVTVSNKSTSLLPGKDVVQLYISAPYYDGIQKSHVTLAAYGKTNILTPGGDPQTLTLKFSLYDVASYDYNDDNKNSFKGWELEAGEYTLYVSKDSHSWADNDTEFMHKFNVPQTASSATAGRTGFTYLTDPHTEGSAEIVNQFDDVSYGSKGNTVYLSRSAWDATWPKTPTDDERKMDDSFLNSLVWRLSQSDGVDIPWYTEDKPTQATKLVAKEEAIHLIDMLDIGIVEENDNERWDEFLNQLTVDQMTTLIGNAAFGTKDIDNIGVPMTHHCDGPSGFYNFMNPEITAGCVFYASQVVMGSTYNVDLIKKYGNAIGNEALFGYEGLPYAGWYAPGANIHRSPFSGRNWEYFSEDPLLTGKMAAEVINGASEKGVITFAKHFALNDHETNRDQNGILIWANEQSMREIYLKAFEILVKEGENQGIMSSYNRIGKTWTGGSYNLITEVLRNEWSFTGIVLTDYATQPYLKADQMLRAGGDLVLLQSGKSQIHSSDSAVQLTQLRRATKNILYNTANSNAMNYEILGYNMAYWVIGVIWLNVGLLVLLLGWGFIAIYFSYKKR